jgi:hypothetical protein
MLTGMIIIFFFVMALSIQRANSPEVVLAPESAIDLASAF